MCDDMMGDTNDVDETNKEPEEPEEPEDSLSAAKGCFNALILGIFGWVAIYIMYKVLTK